MLHEQRQDHGGILGPLGFMDRNGVGKDDFLQIGIIVDDLAPVKSQRGLLKLIVKPDDPADIAVVNLPIIIVADLHDLVPDTVTPPTPLQAILPRIQRLLKNAVQIPQHPPAPGAWG